MQVPLLLLAAVLLPALAVGLLVSLFQAARQIHAVTLSFIPKLLIPVHAIGMDGPWLCELMSGDRILLPIATRTYATTGSMIRNGMNSRKPI